MSLNSPTYRNTRPLPNRPGVPDSRPATNVPRPRTFPANTNRPPPIRVPNGKGYFRGLGLVGLAARAVVSYNVDPIDAKTLDKRLTKTIRGWYTPFDRDRTTIASTWNAWKNNPLEQAPHYRILRALSYQWPGNTVALPNATYHYRVVARGRFLPYSATHKWEYADEYLLLEKGKTFKTAYPLVPTYYPGPAYQPAQVPRYRPREEPLPVPRAVRPIIKPGVGFDISPDAPPRPVRVPETKPPGGVREGKAAGAAAQGIAAVSAALDTATEVADVLAIFWDQLGPKPGETFYDTMLRYMENPSLWDTVDWEGMVRDLIANEVEDQVVGRIHGLKRRLRSEWGTPTYGGAFQGP